MSSEPTRSGPPDLPECVAETIASARWVVSVSGGGLRTARGYVRHQLQGDDPVKGLAQLLQGLPRGAFEQNWMPGTWRGDHRTAENWERGIGVALDFDYHDVDGKHGELPAEVAFSLVTAARRGERRLGNLFHTTPHGCRCVVLVDEQITTPRALREIGLRAASMVQGFLNDAGIGPTIWSDEKARKHRGGLFYDDGKTGRPDACMIAPRAERKGVVRDAEVLVVGSKLFTPPELASFEILRPPTSSSAAAARRTSGRGAAVGRTVSSEIEVAVAGYNAANGRTFPSGRGTCPACGHHDCFGELDGNPERWSCFSANHEADSGGCGRPSPTGLPWFGDALDLDAHDAGVDRAELLRRSGYLRSSGPRRGGERPQLPVPPHSGQHYAPPAPEVAEAALACVLGTDVMDFLVYRAERAALVQAYYCAAGASWDAEPDPEGDRAADLARGDGAVAAEGLLLGAALHARPDLPDRFAASLSGGGGGHADMLRFLRQGGLDRLRVEDAARLARDVRDAAVRWRLEAVKARIAEAASAGNSRLIRDLLMRFEHLADAEASTTERRSLADRLRDYREGRIKRPPVVLAGVLRRGGLLLVSGFAGSGKSQFATAAGILIAETPADSAIITGADDELLSVAPAEDGVAYGVTYLCYEGGEDESDALARIDAFLGSKRLGDPVNFDVQFPQAMECDIRSAQGVRRLRIECERWRKEGRSPVLIIDNVTACCPGLQKTDELEVSSLYSTTFWPIMKAYGATLIVIAHTNRPVPGGDPREALNRIFGSQAWGALCNSAIVLDSAGDSHRRRLICGKVRGFAPFDEIVVNRPQGDCRFQRMDVNESTPGKPGPTRKDYSEQLQRLLDGAQFRTREWMKGKLGCGNDALMVALSMVKDRVGSRFVDRVADRRTRRMEYRVKPHAEVANGGQGKLHLLRDDRAGGPCADGED